MVIQTYNRTYTVIWRMRADSRRAQYLCRSQEEEFTVLVFRDKAEYPPLLTFFPGQVRESFTDFRECFVSDGELYLVFRFSCWPLLAEKLERESVSEAERRELARRLLEQIVCQDMPWGLLCEVLSWDHITVSPGLAIRFLYTLDHPEHLAERTKEEAGQSLAAVLGRLLRTEDGRQGDPRTEDFLSWLREGRFSSCLEIYERFQSLVPAREASAQSCGPPQTPRIRALRAGLSGLRRILAASLLAGAACFLLWSVACYLSPSSGKRSETVTAQPSEENRMAGGFERIGTVTIDPPGET